MFKMVIGLGNEAALISDVVLTLRPVADAPLVSDAFTIVRLAIGKPSVAGRGFIFVFEWPFVSAYSCAHELLDFT
jgi:hypothetical protein